MFQQVKQRSSFQSALSIGEVIYHTTVRSARSGHSNAVISLVLNIVQSCMMAAVFYFMFSVLGLKGAALRGDFLLFVLSGIFVYMTHIKTVSSVIGATDPTSPMMQHAPMTTAVSLISSALSSLYMQTLSLMVILFFYHVLITPVIIDKPIGALGMHLLAWSTGFAVGLVFFALKPWFPRFVGVASNLYRRVNMFASGKMFVANTLPAAMLVMFDWNPLFHIIDQCRGFVFNNYFPRNSSIEYPIYVGLGLFMIGLMLEFYTRQYASSSWSARR